MKIRIHGNSIRIRLSKTEVEKIRDEGYIEEQTSFGNTFFSYALKQHDLASELTASYSENKLTVFVPDNFLTNWPENNLVGFDAKMPIGNNETLYILVEKDFKCLDNPTEDQSDNYENPKTC